MDKSTMTQYAWIIITSMVVAAVMVFATPFGRNVASSMINMAKGQTNEMTVAYSEKGQEETSAYMDSLFDSTHLLSAGTYEHNHSSKNLLTWQQLLNQNILAITNEHLSKGINIKNISGDLIIDNNVKTITNETFMDCDDLNLVRLGYKVETIGDYTFANCDKLQTFIANEKLTTISSSMFENCEKLANVFIGNSITTIKTNAFNECNSLEKIDFAGTIEEWNSINKEDGWNNISIEKIVCTNGTITLE